VVLSESVKEATAPPEAGGPAERATDNPTGSDGRARRTGFGAGGRQQHCAWCGRRLPEEGRVGRPRRYCAQPCRQRAYERRMAVQRGGLPEDAVVLSATELADLQDRLFQLRCAAEDVATAVDDGATGVELKTLAAELVHAAHTLERLR
jgi:hypothetical protein